MGHNDDNHPIRIDGLSELSRIISQRKAHRDETSMPPSQPDIERVDDLALPSMKAIEGKFRKATILVPPEISQAPGLSVFGRKVKSLVFSTDLAIICNCDADAVFAVYPFTCQPTITSALVKASGRPVFTGVAGKTTRGIRSAALAVASEMQGAIGVVMNAVAVPDDISMVSAAVDIPVVLTVVEYNEEVAEKLACGVSIANVAAGKNTVEVVRALREADPHFPIIASGGKTSESVLDTIEAGADAITWVPPTVKELQQILMNSIRN